MEILRAYEARSSLRGLRRTVGVSRNTMSAWIKKADQESPLETTLVPAEPPAVLERDKRWSCVIRKINQS